MAEALLGALRTEDDTHDVALVLARLALEQPECIDRAVGQILREERGRPTHVTAGATTALRRARALLQGVDGGSFQRRNGADRG